MARKHDVVIVGAGLAGLAAARQASIYGADVRVLEASDAVGGRVRSDHVDGFTLDRGFQLYNPAYPEAARVLDHDALELAPLVRGMDIVGTGRHGRSVIRLGDPRSPRTWHTSALSRRAGTIRGKASFAAYARQAAKLRGHEFDERPDEPAQVALARAGLDATLIDEVVRPFLTGVFLEPHLMTSRRFMDVVLASFVKGTPSLPRAGMQAIPEQLHRSLPEGCVCLASPVHAIAADHVETTDGRIDADVVILATDAPHAAELLAGAEWSGNAISTAGNSVTTWYHAVREADLSEPLAAGRGVLTVDAQRRGPVINTVPLTYAVPEYAPPGWVLISSSALGADTVDDAAVRQHLSYLYDCDTSRWDLVAHYAIGYALPSMRGPLTVAGSAPDGPILLAGDYRATASIQGAMVSGRRAADTALDRLGIIPPAVRRLDA